MNRPNRREFLQSSATSLASAIASYHLTSSLALAKDTAKLPVAAIVTEYRKDSHADVIVGKILNGYRQDGGAGPGLVIASLFTDQVPAKDMSRDLASKYQLPIFDTIDQAITLGTNQVKVAGVLSIGEHGQYPMTPDTGQHMYPRRRFFDDIVATFRRCGQAVPVFNDKHLAYRWDDARYMVDTAKRLNFPLLAGSSLPGAWRYPALDLPLDCEIEEALAIGHGGLEAYGFHALEALQCMIERRRGGETGVQAVQAVKGDAIREAEKQGRWSRTLFEAALKVIPNSPPDNGEWIANKNSAVYLMQHRDGLKSSVVMANGLVAEFAVAVKLKGRSEPLATWIKLQAGPPYGHFAYLVQAIEQTIRAGKTVYPVERTLLTTGVLDQVMHSLVAEGKLIETPELNVTYRAVDWPFANHARATLSLPND